MEFEKCRDILLQEIELVREIGCLQERIKEAVINRNWAGFDDYFTVLGEIRGTFAALEIEREALFARGQTDESSDDPYHCNENDSKGRFYAFAARFSDERRNEITAIYRDLKFETLRVQMAGEAFTGFIAGAKAALAGFFEIAFPDRGGKIYTPRGKPLAHDMRSMVLNRTF